MNEWFIVGGVLVTLQEGAPSLVMPCAASGLCRVPTTEKASPGAAPGPWAPGLPAIRNGFQFLLITRFRSSDCCNKSPHAFGGEEGGLEKLKCII